MRNRHKEGKDMPRIVYPNDILPDDNQYTELSDQEALDIMRDVNGKIGIDENR